MTRTVTSVAVTVALCLSVVAAYAQQGGTKEERDACTPDVYKLCSSEIPDEKRIIACLKKNKSKLSPSCYKVFFDK